MAVIHEVYRYVPKNHNHSIYYVVYYASCIRKEYTTLPKTVENFISHSYKTELENQAYDITHYHRYRRALYGNE